MIRTTVMLPIDLKRRARALAQRSGISLGELIRESLEAALRGDAGEVRDDPLFSDTATYDGPIVADLSTRHDDYLYGPEDAPEHEAEDGPAGSRAAR
jgi:hypothetical protein